jgi:hypothetical protein
MPRQPDRHQFFQWPRRRSAAEQRDEIAPLHHSIIARPAGPLVAASLTHNNGGLERIEAAHARMMLKTPLCPRRSAERRAGLYDGTNVRLRTPLEPNIFIVGSVRVA